MNAKPMLFAIAIATAASAVLMSSCSVNDPVAQANSANASASRISRDARAALQSLCAQNPGARALRGKAKAVLVFPSVVKAGFIIGVPGAVVVGFDGRLGRCVIFFAAFVLLADGFLVS